MSDPEWVQRESAIGSTAVYRQGAALPEYFWPPAARRTYARRNQHPGIDASDREQANLIPQQLCWTVWYRKKLHLERRDTVGWSYRRRVLRFLPPRGAS